MNCPKCGAAVGPNTAFCLACGAKVSQPQPAQPQAAVQQPAVQQPAAVPPAAAPAAICATARSVCAAARYGECGQRCAAAPAAACLF